jgi:anti-sigma factor RsiW
MSDCPNVEMREQLPEYLNGTLSDARRTEVAAHLASCEDCAEELSVLQLVREVYAAATPAVNVSAIVSALPRRSSRPVARSWRRSHAFQIAAAVSFISLGAISMTVARSFFNGNPTAATIDTLVAANSAGASIDTPISFAGGVSDLGDEDLEALLTALESIEALPVTEPAELPLTGSGRQGS